MGTLGLWVCRRVGCGWSEELGAAGAQGGAAVGKPLGGGLCSVCLCPSPPHQATCNPWPGGPHCWYFQVTPEWTRRCLTVRVRLGMCWAPSWAHTWLAAQGEVLAGAAGWGRGRVGTGDAREGLPSPLSSPPGISSPLPSDAEDSLRTDRARRGLVCDTRD